MLGWGIDGKHHNNSSLIRLIRLADCTIASHRLLSCVMFRGRMLSRGFWKCVGNPGNKYEWTNMGCQFVSWLPETVSPTVYLRDQPLNAFCRISIDPQALSTWMIMNVRDILFSIAFCMICSDSQLETVFLAPCCSGGRVQCIPSRPLQFHFCRSSGGTAGTVLQRAFDRFGSQGILLWLNDRPYWFQYIPVDQDWCGLI